MKNFILILFLLFTAVGLSQSKKPILRNYLFRPSTDAIGLWSNGSSTPTPTITVTAKVLAATITRTDTNTVDSTLLYRNGSWIYKITTTYNDTPLTATLQSYYAINWKNGKASSPSGTVTVTPTDVTPPAPPTAIAIKRWDTKSPSVPTNLSIN